MMIIIVWIAFSLNFSFMHSSFIAGRGYPWFHHNSSWSKFQFTNYKYHSTGCKRGRSNMHSSWPVFLQGNAPKMCLHENVKRNERGKRPSASENFIVRVRERERAKTGARNVVSQHQIFGVKWMLIRCFVSYYMRLSEAKATAYDVAA